MTIQATIKACLAKKGRYGRPVSWKGSGNAVDLGRRLDPCKARQITPLGSAGALRGESWDVNPEDFLADWEIVTVEDLVCETETDAV